MRITARNALVQKCTCVSMKPGMQIMSFASMLVAPGAAISFAIATIAPSRTCTSPRGKSPIRASMLRTIALRMTNSPRAGSAAFCGCAKSGVGEIAVVASAAPVLRSVRRSILNLYMRVLRCCVRRSIYRGPQAVNCARPLVAACRAAAEASAEADLHRGEETEPRCPPQHTREGTAAGRELSELGFKIFAECCLHE